MHSSSSRLWHQPTSVWAVAFACVISFMGIGLVDPILPAIAQQLDATPSQTMLLFTSYLLVTGAAMFFTSWVSGRIGPRRTLLAGLALIVVFAALAGASGSVDTIIGFRAGWGLGNALFISTALASIVGAATGGSAQAIILYESALGVGIAVGPLLGGLLGSLSWRGPFVGVAVLMALAFALIAVLLPRTPTTTRSSASILDGFRALRHRALLVLALTAVCYNFAFFVLLAYTPFPVEAAGRAAGVGVNAITLGMIFFGWGLMLALSSVFVAQPFAAWFGRRNSLLAAMTLFALTLLAMTLLVENLVGLVVGVVVAGFFLGVVNTVLTESVMEATDLPRNVASGTYSAVRFLGGAVAPAVAGPLAEATTPSAPYLLGLVVLLVGMGALIAGSRAIAHVEHDHAHEPAADVAAAIGAGDAS